MNTVERLRKEVSRVIVGQEKVLEKLAAALFAGGHVLLVGVPGLAKTLMVKTLAKALGLSFSRIQFTPDLMPTDIIGTDILEDDPETGRKTFRFHKGPLFANVILADEINRTPPKTQSALLEAMQELSVTAGGKTYHLEPPFFVLATQNPIEQEGTYPLPEAQLDRFAFQLNLDYPDEQEEREIVERTTSGPLPEPEPVLNRDEIMAARDQILSMPVPPHVHSYAVRLARATRPSDGASDLVKKYVLWGAGPRASQWLTLGAKALSWLRGDPVPTTNHMREIAHDVLRHRIILNFHAEADGITVDSLIDELLRRVPVEP
ncbi:MAG: MoxR family ATPase [candidate division WOR-3 bacterium]